MTVKTLTFSKQRKQSYGHAVLVAAQVIVVLVLLFPMIWLYEGAFRTNLDLDNGGLIPHSFTLENFRSALAQGFPTAMRNSLLVSLVVSLVVTTVATLAAYGLARFSFKGRGLIGTAILAGQAIPGLVILVPLVVVLQKLHLTDSLVGLGIVYLPLGLPVAIYMLRSALIAFSSDIEEAAMCDGANRVAVVRHMVLPLLRPTVIAIGAFTFTLCWGEYLFALSLLTSTSSKTLPLALQDLFSLYTLPLGTILAGGVLVSFPVVLLFLAVQRHLVSGLLAGATKG
jgi:ABC-type glycerol-3-phosphate transport system permease component